MAKNTKNTDNELFSLVGKAKKTAPKTPNQEVKKGVVSPTEKKYLLGIREDWLKVLKLKALENDTSVKELITEAIKEKHFS